MDQEVINSESKYTKSTRTINQSYIALFVVCRDIEEQCLI